VAPPSRSADPDRHTNADASAIRDQNENKIGAARLEPADSAIDRGVSIAYLRPHPEVPMAKLDIIILPDPKLRLTSAPVERVDDETRRFLDDMLETMYEAPGIGLAAIQVGVPRRIITIDVAGREAEGGRAPLFLINPEILSASDERSTYEEGCLSIPDYYAEVERPASVRVRYVDREGRQQELEAEGLLATCIQHEIDHLEGRLFIDYLSRLKREMVVRKFVKAAKTGVKPEFKSHEREEM
jgi:peptide deformylase